MQPFLPDGVRVLMLGTPKRRCRSMEFCYPHSQNKKARLTGGIRLPDEHRPMSLSSALQRYNLPIASTNLKLLT